MNNWAIPGEQEGKGFNASAVRTAPFSKSSVACASRVTIPERLIGGGFEPSTICNAPSQLNTSGCISIVAHVPFTTR